SSLFFYLSLPQPPGSTLFPYTTLFRSLDPTRLRGACDETHVPTATKARVHHGAGSRQCPDRPLRSVSYVTCIFIPSQYSLQRFSDRKSTRLNSSHLGISYAVFCLKKKM